MATFIYLGNMTDDGAKGIKSDAPGRQGLSLDRIGPTIAGSFPVP